MIYKIDLCAAKWVMNLIHATSLIVVVTFANKFHAVNVTIIMEKEIVTKSVNSINSRSAKEKYSHHHLKIRNFLMVLFRFVSLEDDKFFFSHIH